jgi:hypothetical protein
LVLALLAWLAHAIVASLLFPQTPEFRSSSPSRRSSYSERTSRLTMTVQRQSRFSRADQESVNAFLQAYTVSAVEEEGNKKPFVAPGTKAERDRMWEAWTEYIFSPTATIIKSKQAWAYPSTCTQLEGDDSAPGLHPG